jgi:putative transposase
VEEEARTSRTKRPIKSFRGQSAELKHVRADDPDGQARWSFSSQQATLRRLDKAFTAFFKRVREGRTPGFPRFTASPKPSSRVRRAGTPRTPT